jgi:hypothetical protein
MQQDPDYSAWPASTIGFRVGAPGVDPKATFATNSFDVRLVEDLEGEPKWDFEFVLPWEEHRRRPAKADFRRLLSQKRCAGDTPSFHGFNQTDVVSGEAVNPWQAKRLPERLTLIHCAFDKIDALPYPGNWASVRRSPIRLRGIATQLGTNSRSVILSRTRRDRISRSRHL